MNPLTWLRRRLSRHGQEPQAAPVANAPLREFVYLDDVSVYSLLASRRGSIATEFTDTEASGLGGEAEASVEASAGLAKGAIRSRISSSQEQTSQVVRKSIIQSAFKDLYELEKPNLGLIVPTSSAPDIWTIGDVTQASNADWFTDPAILVRGRLIELDVELEAEPVFKISAVFSAFLEIMQEDLSVFGVTSNDDLAQVRTINRVLDKLLAGLVPLRGKAVDFVAVTIDGRELIVHKSLYANLPAGIRPASSPIVVVGVAEHRLFWKDIRRLLFSKARYRLLCRVSASGLQDSWTPVKLADVIGILAPQFESQLLGALGESALNAMGEAATRASESPELSCDRLVQAASVFIDGVLLHHDRSLSADRIKHLAVAAAASGTSLRDTDERRRFFDPLLLEIDSELGVTTSPEVAVESRIRALNESGFSFALDAAPTTPVVHALQSMGDERFLDTEVIAIYW